MLINDRLSTFLTPHESEIAFVQRSQRISSIRKQYISHIFFLPKGEDLVNDSIVLFDRVTTLPSNYLSKNETKEQRLFTLSDFGFYLFLFKLSIHFTRVRENVSRNSVTAVPLNG